MAFSELTVLCNRQLPLVPEGARHPSADHSPTSTRSVPLPQPLATTDLLSVSVDWPVLDISYSWESQIMWLAPVTQRADFRARPQCGLCQRFAP